MLIRKKNSLGLSHCKVIFDVLKKCDVISAIYYDFSNILKNLKISVEKITDIFAILIECF